MAEKTQDRRTRYTLMVIREAFFRLLREKGFDKTTVTDVCREAGINRGTFYLHYVDKYDLLDAMIDEALDAEPPLEAPSLTTMCQRPPANDDYQLLYSSNEVFSRVAQRVIERGAEEGIPATMERTGLNEEDARLLFIFSAHGNLAVNRMLGWQKGPEFFRAQGLLDTFCKGGFDALRASGAQGV